MGAQELGEVTGARLLFAFHDDLDVDRERATRLEPGAQGSCVQQETGLVVDHAPAIEASVLANSGLEGRREPAIQATRRLHVVMRVEESDRGAGACVQPFAHYVGMGTGQSQHLDRLEAGGGEQGRHGLGRALELRRIEARGGYAGNAGQLDQLFDGAIEARFEGVDHVTRCDHVRHRSTSAPRYDDAMEPTSRRIEATHGLSLHLLEWSQEGVPLLLLHGFGNEAHIWDDFAPVVAPHYRTVALDHRGHGASDWDPERRYEHEVMVDDVEAITAVLGFERLVVIGHSLGGRVATLFAGRHPDRLAGLVLVDIGPELDARGTMRIRQDVEADPVPTFGSVAEYAHALSLAYPAGQPEALQRMAQHGLRRREDGRFELVMDPGLRGAMVDTESPEAAAEREAAVIRAQWDALARIQCPTLVVRGAASDILSPETADKMVDEVLANGRLAVVPQAGHSVMTDNPDGFRDSVSAFVLSG